MPEKVRIALVMNGGVSLAVWMGGVTHEIDRLRNATVNDLSPWGVILAAAKREVEVDLIAGSSAGGLNGAMLATAIARGGELPPLLDMWREQARLQRGKLLRSDPGESPNSLLDGDFFSKSLTIVMNGISASQPGGADVTLMVTASALQGSSRAVIDACGEKFVASDHRRVYRFRRRNGKKKWDQMLGAFTPLPLDEFTPPPEGIHPLIVAARASAGFPVAFEPVQETPALHALNVVDSEGEPAWLMDGGVLDNAPFGPVLDELIERPRGDAGPRWVVYVVPHTDFPALPTPADPNPRPPAWTNVLGAVLTLSRESDLRSDVMSVSDRHRAAHSTVARPEELLGDGVPGVDWADAVALATDLLPVYRRTTAKETAIDVLGAGAAGSPVAAVSVAPVSIDAVLALNPSWIATSLSPTRLIGDNLLWQWGVGRAKQMATWISRAVRQLDLEPAEAEVALAQIVALQEDLLALHEGFSALHSEAFAAPEPIVGNLVGFNEAVQESPLLPALTTTMNSLVNVWETSAGLNGGEGMQRLLTVEVLSHALSWGQPMTPPFDLVLLGPKTPDGPWLIPYEMRPSLSKLDGWPNPKLYGDRFMNFGAFGRDSFKEWDWMWGRLDGAITLAKALLTGNVTDADMTPLIDPLVDQILAECGQTRTAVYDHCVEVLAMQPSALIASARDSGETHLDAMIDDAASMLNRNTVVDEAALPLRLWIRAFLKPGPWLAKREARKL